MDAFFAQLDLLLDGLLADTIKDANTALPDGSLADAQFLLNDGNGALAAIALVVFTFTGCLLLVEWRCRGVVTLVTALSPRGGEVININRAIFLENIGGLVVTIIRCNGHNGCPAPNRFGIVAALVVVIGAEQAVKETRNASTAAIGRSATGQAGVAARAFVRIVLAGCNFNLVTSKASFYQSFGGALSRREVVEHSDDSLRGCLHECSPPDDVYRSDQTQAQLTVERSLRLERC
jgi:hypothetical protein